MPEDTISKPNILEGVNDMKTKLWGGGILLAFVISLFITSQYSAATYNIHQESKANKVFVSDPKSTFTYCNHSAEPLSIGYNENNMHVETQLADGPVVGSVAFHPGPAIRVENIRYYYPNIPVGRAPDGMQMSVRWDNVGKMNDRWVRVFMTIYNIDYCNHGTSPSPHPSFTFYKDFWYGVWMHNISSANFVYRFYYMDTGERVDMTNNYVTWCSLNVGEGVAFTYDGQVDGYISDDSFVEWRGSYYGSTSDSFDDYIGGPTLYKSGITFKVPTRDVDARLFGSGNTWIKPDFASLFATIPEPVKTVDKERAKLGDSLIFSIDQGLSGVTLYKYNSMAIEDNLPEEVDYVSSKVRYKVGGFTRVLTKNVDYTESLSGRKLRITLSNSFVSNLKYSDERIFVDITTKVNEKAMSVDKIKNKSTTFVNTSSFDTNWTETVVDKYKIITSKEGEGTITPTIENIPQGEDRDVSYTPADGWYLEKILVDDIDKGITYPTKYSFTGITANHKVHAIFKPYHKVTTEVINGTISNGNTKLKDGDDCSITYSPSAGYYLKTIEVDGTSINIEDNMESYDFTDITEDHHIKVVYAKIPTLTIIKKINKDELVWDKGYPYFSFKIDGTDHLGNKVTLYKSIKFGESDSNSKQIAFKIPAGVYTISELVTNEWSLLKVENVENCSISGSKATCDLRDVDTGKCRFTNEFVDYNNYTENNDKVNRLK